MKVIYFTTWKCAPTFIVELCGDISSELSLPFYSPNTNTNVVRIVREATMRADPFWGHEAFVVGPVRRPTFVPADFDLRSAKAVIHLRDPRDLLTSLYFHIIFSKPDATDAEREEARSLGIDRFVLERAPNMLKIFVQYLEISRQYEIPILTYEEMVLDTDAYMSRMAAATGLTPAFAATMAAKHRPAFRPVQENVAVKKRKITPGDHKEKLAPETSARLFEEFDSYFDAVGAVAGPTAS